MSTYGELGHFSGHPNMYVLQMLSLKNLFNSVFSKKNSNKSITDFCLCFEVFVTLKKTFLKEVFVG